MILVIDNYDSFVWNLVQAVGSLLRDRGASEDEAVRTIRVARNDELSAVEIARLRPMRILLSPGPCSPAEAGVCTEVVRALGGVVPILGVCLGHQAIAAAAGAPVVRATRVMHGKTSLIHHEGAGVLRGLPSPFVAARYHSLVIPAGALCDAEWETTAWTDDDGERVVMGLRRRWEGEGMAPLEGVQFHPESFLTPEGHRVLSNFLFGGLEVPRMAPSPAATLAGAGPIPETV